MNVFRKLMGHSDRVDKQDYDERDGGYEGGLQGHGVTASLNKRCIASAVAAVVFLVVAVFFALVAFNSEDVGINSFSGDQFLMGASLVASVLCLFGAFACRGKPDPNGYYPLGVHIDANGYETKMPFADRLERGSQRGYVPWDGN